MKKSIFYLMIPLLLVSLVGCAETRYLEQVSLITLIGYDVGKEEEVSSTAVIRQVNPEFQSNVVVITDENKTSRGALSEINRKTTKKTMAGQKRVTLFGEELAKQGIGHYLDTLSKSPTSSGAILIAVVEGETKPLLEHKYENVDDVGQHIFKLLEQNIENEQLISSTLHEVGHDYYSLGRDIAIPLIKKDNELIEVSGLAIFNEDKLVGSISADDAFFVLLSRTSLKDGTLEVVIKESDVSTPLKEQLPGETAVVLDSIKSERTYKLKNASTPEFDLDISIEARVTEIDAEIDVDNPTNVKAIEKAISKSLSEDLLRVFAYSQEVNSDVYGLGEQYRSSVRQSNLTHDKWHEMYKTVKLNVHIDTTVVRSGVFE